VAALAPDGTLVAMLDESGAKARSHVVFAPAGS
jgi:tRNA pseudouridine55 synthase